MFRRPDPWTPRVLLVALALLLPTLPGCITDPVTGESKLGFMSEEQEAEMGKEFGPSFKAQYEGAYPDAALQRHCERIVLGMAKESHRPTVDWNFTILNSSQVNAFALPGGTVCITRGLLWRMDTEAMFAGVMGHEIGHVSHRHSVQGQARGTLAQVLIAGVAVGVGQTDSEWGQVGLALGAAGAQLVLLSYNRDQESESDDRGVEYSYDAGYDPRELAKVFKVFQELKGGQEQPAWLSTHPLDADRIQAVQDEVAKRYPKVVATNGAGLKKSTPEWDRMLAKLLQDQKVYDDYDGANKAFAEAVKSGNAAGYADVLRTLESCRSRLPGHALFTSGIGVVLHTSGQTAKAKSYFVKAAAQQRDLFEPRLYLTQIAYDGRDSSGVQRWGKEAETLFPHHPRATYLMARTYDSSGDFPRAAKRYERVMGLTDEKSEEHRYSAQRLQQFQAQGIAW